MFCQKLKIYVSCKLYVKRTINIAFKQNWMSAGIFEIWFNKGSEFSSALLPLESRDKEVLAVKNRPWPFPSAKFNVTKCHDLTSWNSREPLLGTVLRFRILIDVVNLTIYTYLFGELFLAQFVEGVELSGQNDVVDKSDGRQFDADDDLTVRNHHGDRPEVDLEVLRKFLSSCVSGILEAKHYNSDDVTELSCLPSELR